MMRGVFCFVPLLFTEEVAVLSDESEMSLPLCVYVWSLIKEEYGSIE